MTEQKPLIKEFTKGIIKENPVLCLVLGTCPTLAVTTGVSSALGMGIAATAVLVCSNSVISLLRKLIPQKVRIPAYITVIASFVTIVQMIIKAYAPALNDALGVYLPLIVVNCIILGRAEMFASKHGAAASALDGLGMGIGFTAALFIMGSIREILGAGSWLGLKIPFLCENPILIFILPPGGFFVFGMLMALANKLNSKNTAAKTNTACSACPMNDKCSRQTGKECRN
ncbi:MAG: electron transport complex subunit E [Acutalibacteraceae bacterium]|nr:electron transport complex subunit E [Clostridia bacterium]MEE3449968.1 electron transport complex subunit E [Acutalibacteraceae bacterium]